MRKLKRSKAFSALTMAAAVGMYGHVARGVTVTQSYVQGFISDTSDFSDVLTAVDLSGANPTVSLPVGDFFEFGIADAVTGNVNPVAGDKWDIIDSKKTTQGGKGAPAVSSYAANLGLGSVGYVIPSSDSKAAKLMPLQGSGRGNDPNPPFVAEFNATSAINGDLNGISSADPGDTESNNGTVGINFPIFIGASISHVNTAGSSGEESKSGLLELGNFADNAAQISSGTDNNSVFSGLGYAAQAAGTVTLSPAAVAGTLEYWSNVFPGSTASSKITADPTYALISPGGGDTVTALAPLVITITGGVTPAGPVITLTSGTAAQTLPQLTDSGTTTANGAHQGKFTPGSAGSNILKVTGSNGGYIPGEADGINNSGTGDGSDYVKIAGFSPNNDQEIYALKLDNNGSAIHGNAALIAAIINDINAANDAAFGLTTASGPQLAGTLASNPSVATLFPNFDILLTIPLAFQNGLAAGSPTQYNFGFDFTSYTDAGAGVGAVTATNLGVVPEPSAAMGALALGGLGMFSYRRRKQVNAKA